WVPATFRIDLMDKTVVMRPWRALSSRLGYTIHLQPTLHSLQGCAAEETVRSFQTGDGPAGGEPAAAIPAFAEVVDVPSRAQSLLPLVDPGNAARSVLFRKLIPATAGGAPPPPTLGHR